MPHGRSVPTITRRSTRAPHGRIPCSTLELRNSAAGRAEKALDQLEPLLKMPYFLSPGWIRIDPNFTPLRGNPRFERLVNGP